MRQESSDRERGGILGSIKNSLAEAIGATRTRVDHFQADVEHRLFRTLALLLWSVVAFVCLSLGVTFAVLTIIFGFGLPPKYAFGIPALLLLAVGAFAVVMLRLKKRSKPKHKR
jgi:Putative Actinobacterial Holin-X, holin superfamily III